MANSAYDRWLKFIAKPYSETGLTFPAHEARAIMRIPLSATDPDWRRTKRTINKVARLARAESRDLLRLAKDASARAKRREFDSASELR